MSADHRARRAQLVTASQARDLAGIEQSTLRDWCRRGLLTRHGGHRNPLYDIDELARAAAAEKPRRARNTPLRALGA